jgi:hypothetical protein
MKSITKSLTVALLVVTMGSNAIANGHRGHFPQSPQRHSQIRGHDSGWIAPLLFLGLAGAVIGAAASQQSASPPTYVQPPVTYATPNPAYVTPVYTSPAIVAQTPPQQPANVWYFCKSVGQYYPYTPFCPEGWQPVSPTPQ